MAKPGESGRIENPAIAADLIAYNQHNHVGLSIAGEGRVQRATGINSRSEPPIRVHVDSSIHGTNVADAMEYWHSVAGLERAPRRQCPGARYVTDFFVA